MTRMQGDEAWGCHTSSHCGALLLVFIERAPNGHNMIFLHQPSVQLIEPLLGARLSPQVARNQILILLGCSDFKVGLPT